MTGVLLHRREAGRRQGCLLTSPVRLRPHKAELRCGVLVGGSDSLAPSASRSGPPLIPDGSFSLSRHPLLIFATLLVAAGGMTGSQAALAADPPRPLAPADPPALERPGDPNARLRLPDLRFQPVPAGHAATAGSPLSPLLVLPPSDRLPLPALAFPPFPGSPDLFPQAIHSARLQFSRSAELAAPIESPRLHQAFLRDRRVEQKLRTADKHLESGELSAAWPLLQDLLDAPDDVLIVVGMDPIPRSARHHAADRIARSGTSGRALYETLYGEVAERFRVEALSRGDESALVDVARRYFHTAAGRKASLALIQAAVDRGQLRRAAAGVRELWFDPVHRRGLSASDRARAAIASERAGERALAIELARTTLGETLYVAGASLPARELLEETIPLAAETRLAGAGDFASPVELVAFRADPGNPSSLLASRPEFLAGSPPVADEVAWEMTLGGKESAHLEPLVHAWLGYQTTHGLPTATANTPLIIGDYLVFRDFDGIRCVESASGRLLWNHATRTPLARDLPSQLGVPVEGNPDPGGIRRLWVGNALMGRLSSDGHRVYAIDSVESRWNQANVIGPDGLDTIALARQSNRLIALRLSGDSGSTSTDRMLWSVGGPRPGTPPGQAPNAAAVSTGEPVPSADAPVAVLAGHYFLGVPAHVDGALLVISEFDTQVYVSALRPKDGELLWSRPVAMTTTPIHLDQQRYAMTAVPVVGDGIVVVPTHAGVLLGLDLLTGALRWGHEYDDAEQLQLLGAWPNNTRMQHGHSAYPNDPIIHAGRILYLPPHSGEIHCLELRTGRRLWAARREDQDQSQAIEHVAAADGNTLLVVGRSRCRGLDIATGREVWSRPLASSPAGRGARQGHLFLVPLTNGAIQSVEISTGRQIGVTISPEAQWTGNLAVGRDVVVGLSAGRVRAWPQALPLLERLDRAEPWASRRPHARLLAARTALALGQTVAAKQELRHILSDDQLSETTAVAERLLRELLFVELSEQSPDSQSLFGDLEPLIASRGDRSRLLAHRVLFERRQGNVDGLFDTAGELLSLSLSDPLVLDHDPALAVAPDAWVRAMLTRNLESAPQARHRLSVRLDARRLRAISEGDETTLRHLALLDDYPEIAQGAAIELANRQWSRGKYQQAELRLLDARRSTDADVYADATQKLANLWTERGLHHEAALLWKELDDLSVQSDSRRSSTGGRMPIATADPDGMTARAYARLSPRPDFGRSPRITEQRWVDSRLQATYNGSGIQYLPTPRASSFDLFDKGKGTGGLLALVDRHSGLEFDETIRIPSRYFYPNSTATSFVGHLLPLGALGAVHGVSLLDRQIVWTVVPPGLANRAEVIRVGPAGPSFAVFQCRQHLFAVDPATGDLLWQRTDLESQAGLQADTASGLFGDASVLTVFRADRNHYTLYDTATGIELARGALDADRRQPRKAFGRRLVYMTSVSQNPGRRLRIWDPVRPHLLLDEPGDSIADMTAHNGAPAGTKAFQFVRGADELAWITSDGRLKVVDVHSGELRIQTQLPETLTGQIGLFRISTDHDRYYVNLQSTEALSGQMQASFIVSDSTLPVEHFQGHLVTISRRDGELLWSQAVGNRSLVSLPEYRLPVLVFLCRARQANQLAGEVLVLDAETGAELARRGDLSPDRLLQVSYDRDQARLDFRGARTEIGIDFLPEPLWSPDVAGLNR